MEASIIKINFQSFLEASKKIGIILKKNGILCYKMEASKKDRKFNFIMEASNLPIFYVTNIINKNTNDNSKDFSKKIKNDYK